MRPVLTAVIILLCCTVVWADKPARPEPPEPVEVDWSAYGLKPTDNPACRAQARATVNDWWMKRHRHQKKQLTGDAAAKAKVLFLGDSITMMWHPAGKWANGMATWKKVYEPMGAVMAAISGDKTDQLLWRFAVDGMLDDPKLRPEVVVLMIGTNNLSRGDKPEQVAEGIRYVVEVLKKKLPEAKVLLLGVFPRGFKPNDHYRKLVARTNAVIAKLDDRKRVWYLDIGNAFLEPDGSASREVIRDSVHLSARGYELWAEAMTPYLEDLLKTGGAGDLWDEQRNKRPKD